MRLIYLLMLFAAVPLAFATLSGPSPIPNPPAFSVTSTITNLCRGLVNHIPIIVTNQNSNIGATMQNVQLGISNGKGLYAAGNGTINTANISVGHSAVIIIPVFVAANASTFISTGIGINYYFDTLYSDSEVRNVSFSTETCSMPLSVSVSPKLLTAGVIQNLQLNLTNIGSGPLTAVAVKVGVPSQDGAMLTSQPLQLSDVAGNSTSTLNEVIFVSKNASESMPLNITASFYNGTNLEQLSESVSVLASGIVNLTPSGFTVSPSVPTPQSTFSISFILTDTGTTGASAMTITPLPPAGFTVYGANSVFVGDLAVDTQTPVTVSFFTGNNLKAGSYNIPIRVNYLNSLRQNITYWANTSVILGASTFNSTAIQRFRSSSGGGSSGLLIIILLVIIVVLGYFLYKERKRRPK
jgi:hypothetical protein